MTSVVEARQRSSAGASTRAGDDSPLPSAHSLAPAKAAKWERILYRRQPYPDNHTDDSFLERLVLNGRITPRRLSRVILDATTVSQQLAVVALKAAAVAHLLDDGSGAGCSRPHSLMLLDGVLLLCGVIANVVLHGPAHAARQSARVGPALLLGLFALTPLFHTMTAAISDDTAVATATCSLLLHLLTHDYALLDSYTARLGGSASLGAAMFAAALLASRLPTTSAVFADMLLALVLFVLFPFLRRDVRRASTAAHLALTAAVHAATLAAVLALPGSGRLIAAGYVAAVAGIVLACPVWLIRMMAFKEQINGPWDEAKPDLSLLKGGRAREARVDREGGQGVGF
uniref:Phosphatidylinositol N-acetylglucosaminyltransferase n=1 Tax=Mantoniella antarctica TaxID=81844 RepID=A0A7S0X999_9CHLO|mmetsp:Transcript_29460/g.73498  ORF Transcript_29460/g.73498 Transcript_29460/m.73498 type:complete len:344 (+) Transcript_29460:125-1156(+)|eukprot:CAMPEP_0181353514 /NCGR_PEP_ID=MMETSP1106-20121128/2873_1 /TAXON_ID=81844 /ORGANISM="Mantoniella antarctica, Strain SL-175" /LENGTH=343 /DNA_ID=CAMNT_0023466125 /DNA_START=194 /DNA_END=1225 /DNA_ORIENTATION=+